METNPKIVVIGKIETVHRKRATASRDYDAAIMVEDVLCGELTHFRNRSIEIKYLGKNKDREAYKAIYRRGILCYFEVTGFAEKTAKRCLLVSDVLGVSKTAVQMARQNLKIDPNIVRNFIIKSGGFSIAEQKDCIDLPSEIQTIEVCNLRKWLNKHGLRYDLDLAWALLFFFRSRAKQRSSKDNKINVISLLDKNPLMISDFDPSEFPVSALKKVFEKFGYQITPQMELYARISSFMFKSANAGHSAVPLQSILYQPEIRKLLDTLKYSTKYPARVQEFLQDNKKKSEYRCANLIFESKLFDITKQNIRDFYFNDLGIEALDDDEVRTFNATRFIKSWMLKNFSMAVYLSGLHAAEKHLAAYLVNRIKNRCSPLRLSPKSVDVLNEEQKEAVRKACESPVSVVLGGAGTGKTFFIQTLSKAVSAQYVDVFIAAPTATAAANVCRDGDKFPYFTIHRFANISTGDDDYGVMHENFFASDFECKDGSVVIIDEMSMCTLPMLHRFFSHINNIPNLHVVLVGDPAQLPAVGSNIFYSFANKMFGEDIPVTCLSANLRAKNVIDKFTRDIRNGVFSIPDKQSSVFLQDTDAESFFREHINLVTDMFDQTLVLVTTRREQSRVNEMLRSLANRVGDEIVIQSDDEFIPSGFFVNEPVIGNRNDYAISDISGDEEEGDKDIDLFFNAYNRNRHKERDITIYNGTRGIIKSFDAVSNTVMIKLFPPEFPDGVLVPYCPEELSSLFDLAYCITTHKAQGAEENNVVLIAESGQSGNSNLSRELLYTAATRAKKKIFFVGNEEMFQSAALRQSETPFSLLPFRYDIYKHFPEKMDFKRKKSSESIYPSNLDANGPAESMSVPRPEGISEASKIGAESDSNVIELF